MIRQATRKRPRKVPRKPRSTRGRRPGLTRERVLAEARALLDAQGLDALSMRVLARRLGVSTMALYNHVRDKQDLIQGIAQAVVQEFQAPPASGDWRERVRTCFRTLRRICLASPRAIPVVEGAQDLGPAVFRPMEVTLAALQEAGLDPTSSMRAYFLLTNFTMGQVSYEIRGPFRGLDPGEAARRGIISAADFPLVTSATSSGAWDFDAAFETGLDIIIEGLATHGAR